MTLIDAPEREGTAAKHPEAAGTKQPKKRFSLFHGFGWLVTALLCFFIIYPLFRTLLSVVGVDDDGWQLPRLFEVWGRPETLQSLLNLLIAVGIGGGIAMIVGSFLAWLNVRSDARIGWAADALPLVSLFVPAIASAVGWVFLASPQAGFLNVVIRGVLSLIGIDLEQGPLDIFTWPGLIFVYVLFLTPYAYLAVSTGLQSLDPALEEAARMSGHGPFSTVFKIALPNLVPALGAAAVQVLTIGFALFAAPVVIGTAAGIEVLPVSIVYSLTREYPPDLYSAVGMSLVLVCLVVAATRSLKKITEKGNYAKIGGRGARQNLVQLGKWKWLARSVMVGYLVLTSVLPFIGLLFVSLQGFWSANVKWSTMSLDNYEAIGEQALLKQGLQNSLFLGLGVATAAVFLTAITAYLIHRRNNRTNRAIDAVLKVPAAISHIVVGIAFLVAFSGAPFKLNGTLMILLLAYVVIFIPQASLYANSAVQQIGKEMVEAAEVSGARPGRIYFRVMLPLMVPSLVAAWALLFVLGASEVNASSMLSGPGAPVVGMAILDLFTNGTYPRLAALGVVISLISSVVVVSVLIIGRRSSRRS
jgi:iron(III) transport system permease protein